MYNEFDLILRYARLCVRLVQLAFGIKLHASTAFSPQVDGQSGRSEATIKTVNGFVKRL